MPSLDSDTALAISSLGASLSLLTHSSLRAELVKAAPGNYFLEIRGDAVTTGGVARLRCSRAADWGKVSGPVVGLLGGPAAAREVIPFPRDFLAIDSVQSIGEAVSVVGPGSFSCQADLIGIFKWALGCRGSFKHPDENWSYLAWDGAPPWTTSIAFLDEVLSAIVSAITGLRDDRSNDGGSPVVITGDTDDASEAQLLGFLEKFTDAGLPVTLLLRHCEQLTPRVVSALGNLHELGVHPWSRSGRLSEFLQDLRALSDCVEARTGQKPIAIRHHRFQWFSPNAVRSAAADHGIGFEFNLVAASGRTWIGAPCGAARPLAAYPPGGGQRPMWVMPTCIEDDVFLYDESFCFTHSQDPETLLPKAFLAAFLDDWSMGRHYPACVNLHPEHFTADLRWVMDTVLMWCVMRDVRCVRLSNWRNVLDDGIVG